MPPPVLSPLRSHQPCLQSQAAVSRHCLSCASATAGGARLCGRGTTKVSLLSYSSRSTPPQVREEVAATAAHSSHSSQALTLLLVGNYHERVLRQHHESVRELERCQVQLEVPTQQGRCTWCVKRRAGGAGKSCECASGADLQCWYWRHSILQLASNQGQA